MGCHRKNGRPFLVKHPDAIIVNLGCGPDTIFGHIDNGRCRFVNIDFPETIGFREKLFGPRDRGINIGRDVNDHSRMDEIGYSLGDSVSVMGCGVLFCLQSEDVRRLIDAIGGHFPGAAMCFDYENVKMLAKSDISVKTGNKGAWMPFSMEDADKEIRAFSDTVESVDMIKELPPDYGVLPLLHRWFFSRCMKKEPMTFITVGLKGADD